MFSKLAYYLLHEQNLDLTQVIPRKHTRQKLDNGPILSGFLPLYPNLLWKNRLMAIDYHTFHKQ